MSVNQAIVISDLHQGCQFAVCPPEGIKLDGGGVYTPDDNQLVLWKFWRKAWDEWVPHVTKGEPYVLIINGDTLDGVHHNSNTQITHNMECQRRQAFDLLAPLRDKAAALYMTRGTEAHVGQSAENEEELAKDLGAEQDRNGRHSRYELWIRLGEALVHCAHHIGTTGSMAYETSALMRELAELLGDSARWGTEPPDVVVRSHRHRHVEVRIPTRAVYGICFTTPAWQLRTPFAYKIPGGRVSTPHIGMSLVRYGDEEVYTRHLVGTVPRSKPVIPEVAV